MSDKYRYTSNNGSSGFKPQEHWHKYNIPKQWVDGVGWCDMNGVKIDSNYKPSEKFIGRYYSDKVSFFGTLLKYFFKLLKVFLLWVAISLVLVAINIEQIFKTITIIFVLIFLGFIIHFMYFIIRCAIEHNLRL